MIAAEVLELLLSQQLEKVTDSILQGGHHQIHCAYLMSVIEIGEKIDLESFSLRDSEGEYIELKDQQGTFAIIDKHEFCMYVQYTYDTFRPDTWDVSDLCELGYEMGKTELQILRSTKCIKEFKNTRQKLKSKL